jgi:hypothetical protein
MLTAAAVKFGGLSRAGAEIIEILKHEQAPSGAGMLDRSVILRASIKGDRHADLSRLVPQ